MEPEQTKEWAALESEAVRLLRDGQPVLRRGVGRVIHLLALPSFEPALGYEIYRDVSDSSGTRYQAVRTRWERSLDLKKFITAVKRSRQLELLPTFRRREFPIDTDYMDVMLRRIAEMTLAPLPGDNPAGCDGTSYEVDFGDFFADSRFQWWEDGPANWRELTLACRELLGKLDFLAGETEYGGQA